MDDFQSEYDDLVSEIHQRGNLDENDRLRFYKLHKNVSSPNADAMDALLKELRRQKGYNEHYILSDEERAEIFGILETKRNNEGLNRFEYRYLAFLVWRYGFASNASFPCFPQIIDITIKDLEEQFAFNAQRQKLLDVFKKGMMRCLELYNLDQIEVLLGGSYTNKNKDAPNDIDPLLLLPKVQWHTDRNHATLNKIIREFQTPDGQNIFDLHKMLSGLSDNHYMTYELITLMANSPESKIESGIKDMKFACRDLFRMRLRREDPL